MVFTSFAHVGSKQNGSPDKFQHGKVQKSIIIIIIILYMQGHPWVQLK
jgi:hypothetical protein